MKMCSCEWLSEVSERPRREGGEPYLDFPSLLLARSQAYQHRLLLLSLTVVHGGQQLDCVFRRVDARSLVRGAGGFWCMPVTALATRG